MITILKRIVFNIYEIIKFLLDFWNDYNFEENSFNIY